MQGTPSSKQEIPDQKAAGSHTLQQDQQAAAAAANQSPEVDASVPTAVHRPSEREKDYAPTDTTSPSLCAEPAQQPHQRAEEFPGAALNKEQYQSPVTGRASSTGASLQSIVSLSASHAGDTQLASLQHISDLTHEVSSSASQASTAEELDALSPDEDDFAEHLELTISAQPSTADQIADSPTSSPNHSAAITSHDDAETTSGAEADEQQVSPLAGAVQSIEPVSDAAQDMANSQAHASTDEQEQSKKEQAHQDGSKVAVGLLSTTQTDGDNQDIQDASQHETQQPAQQSQQALSQSKTAEDIEFPKVSSSDGDGPRDNERAAQQIAKSAMDKAEETECRLLNGKSFVSLQLPCQCQCACVQAPDCSLRYFWQTVTPLRVSKIPLLVFYLCADLLCAAIRSACLRSLCAP